MKSLMQLVLIDEAIDALNGVFPGAFSYLFHGTHGFATSNWSQIPGFSRVCTRDEFEARKAERQNKPDWGKSSDWAHWLAQDSAGSWWWYPDCVSAPVLGGERFINQSVDRVIFARSGVIVGDWRNTLEQRPNHIGESDEKVREVTDFALKIAVVSPGLAVRFVHQQLPALFDNSPKLDGASDWYDYDKQQALRLPPVGLKVSYFNDSAFISAGGDRNWRSGDELDVLAHTIVNGNKICVVFNTKHETAQCLVTECIRPLDWNRNLQPNPEPEQSPELSFHLSNAFNELQASARLLSEDDPRRASIVSLASGIGAVREVV